MGQRWVNSGSTVGVESMKSSMGGLTGQISKLRMQMASSASRIDEMESKMRELARWLAEVSSAPSVASSMITACSDEQGKRRRVMGGTR